jgi:hypothetical protein
MSDEGRVMSPEEKEAAMRGDLKGAGMEEAKQATETVKEEVKEVVKEEVKTEVKTEVKEEAPQFDLASFNKRFKREIESEDAFETLFEKADKYDDTKSSYDDTLQKMTEYKTLAEQLDPMSNFLNEDEYKRQQFLKSNIDSLGEEAIQVLSTLNPSKVKEMGDVDALKTQLMVDIGLNGVEADAYLLQKYNVEGFDSEDLDIGVKATMKVDGKAAKDSLGKLYDGIDVPTKTDYETARTELKQSWDTPLDELVKGIDNIQIAEGLDFSVTDEMKQGVKDSSLAWLMSKQVKPSEEAAASLVGQIKDQIVLKNIDKIVKSITADLTEKLKSDTRGEIHNDKPLNESSRTKEGTDDNNDSKMSKLMGN